MPEQDKLTLGSVLSLECDDKQSPSPHILRRLAEHLAVSYLKLMRLAGYDVSKAEKPTRRAGALADALVAEPLTDDEQQAVAAFMSALRAGRGH